MRAFSPLILAVLCAGCLEARPFADAACTSWDLALITDSGDNFVTKLKDCDCFDKRGVDKLNCLQNCQSEVKAPDGLSETCQACYDAYAVCEGDTCDALFDDCRGIPRSPTEPEP